jgi:hypothetical protein
MHMSNSWSEMKKTLLTKAMSFIEKLVVPTPPPLPSPPPTCTPPLQTMLAFWEACDEGDLMQVQCIINADTALGETMLEACANFGLRLALQKQHFDVASWILSRRDNTVTALKKVLTDLLLSDVPVEVATFQWLLDFTMDEESFVCICSVACFAGALDLCKWLHSRDLWLRHHVPVLWPSEVRERVRRACQAGKMEMVSWVCEVHDVTDTTFCDLGYAIASGSEEVCHWVLSHLSDSLTDSDIEYVSSLGFRGGNVPCLQWWLEVPGVLDTLKKCGVMLPWIARQSFRSGVLAPVEFVYEYFAGQGVQLTNTDSSPFLWPASHLDLIQWVTTTMVPNIPCWNCVDRSVRRCCGGCSKTTGPLPAPVSTSCA